MSRSEQKYALEIGIKTIDELRRGLGADNVRGLSRVKFHLSEAKEIMRKEINRLRRLEKNG